MSIPPRQILKTSPQARNAVRELLQTIFAAELVMPSRHLWLVSPWIRNVPVLDNRTGTFSTLGNDLPRSEVHLAHLLRELVERGTRIIIATRPEPGNRQLLDAIGLDAVNAHGRIVVHERGDLHAKGIVGDRFSLVGSMNLTFNGLDHLTEMLVFQTDPAQVEALRVMFRDEYGGSS